MVCLHVYDKRTRGSGILKILTRVNFVQVFIDGHADLRQFYIGRNVTLELVEVTLLKV